MMLVFFASVVSVSAQTARETQKPLDNLYVGLFGGVNTPLSFNQMFPLNTVVGLRLGKDITPIFGFNVEGSVWLNDTENGHYPVYTYLPNRAWQFDRNLVNHFAGRTAIKAVNVGANVTTNLTNMLLGYKGTPRLFEISAITGLGWMHVYDAYGKDDNLTGKTGLDLAFNLGKSKAWQLYIEPAIFWNLTDNDAAFEFNKNKAFAQVSVGVIYRFKNSNGTHSFVTYNIGAMNDEINSLRKQLAAKPKVVTNTEKVVETVQTNWVVFFAQNSAELTDEAKQTLNEIAPNTKVMVEATASPEGEKEYNQSLSQKRANNVADYLTTRGVNVKAADGLGVTGNASNRVAIVTVSE